MPQPDTREDREQQILEAAMAVFAREGFHDARMEDIARQSGLAKGTLYLYFKSKDAIIGALLRYFFSAELRNLKALEHAPGLVAERLLDYSRHLAAEAERMAMFSPIAYEFYAVAGRDKGVRQFFKDYFTDYHVVLTRMIQRGIAGGEFRPVDAAAIATALMALLEGLNLLGIVDPKAFNLREQAATSVRLLLDALKTA